MIVKHFHLYKLLVNILSSYLFVRLPNCPVTKLSGYQIVWLPKCQLPKCQLPKCNNPPIGMLLYVDDKLSQINQRIKSFSTESCRHSACPPASKKKIFFQGIVLTNLLDLTPVGSAERKGICPGTVLYPTPAGYYLVYLTL